MRKTHYYQGCPGVVKHAYDTNDILAYAGSAGIEPVILPKKNRKVINISINCFLTLKRWRGIAIRDAKASDAFIAAVHVRCIAIWAAIRA